MPDDPIAPLVADFARYRVDPEEQVTLADLDTDDTDDIDARRRRCASSRTLNERIADLQARLYAEEKRAVLVVLQGIDAAGKDSTVKHVFRGTNPQGVRVYTFKEPTAEEAAHDFLWRYHQDAPALGMIHVFNRSHYEDVLVVRVKDLIEEERWRSRYDSINDFERMLAREGTVIVKFFLHISKDAQLDRFRERLEREDKHYKFSANDVRERRNWDAYQEAYEDAVNLTSTPWAPWYVVPADHKWYRNLVVARIVAATLEAPRPAVAGAGRGPRGLRARGAGGERLLQAVGERLAGQLLADVEQQRGAGVVDELAAPAGASAGRGRRPAASSSSRSEWNASSGAPAATQHEIAVPEAGELERVVERLRARPPLGPSRALGELGLAPLVLLLREVLELFLERRLDLVLGRGAARSGALEHRPPGRRAGLAVQRRAGERSRPPARSSGPSPSASASAFSPSPRLSRAAASRGLGRDAVRLEALRELRRSTAGRTARAGSGWRSSAAPATACR